MLFSGIQAQCKKAKTTPNYICILNSMQLPGRRGKGPAATGGCLPASGLGAVLAVPL